VIDMTDRTVSAIVGTALSALAFGCGQSPTSPSTAGATASAASAGAVGGSAATSAIKPSRFGDRAPGVVFVTSQGLYYDTFVVKDPLPMHGPFQRLTNGETEFGPGEAGYLGGRWWEDLNGDGIQDAGDHYFLCPLLPPGRTTP
jgi:hypothetical protein